MEKSKNAKGEKLYPPKCICAFFPQTSVYNKTNQPVVCSEEPNISQMNKDMKKCDTCGWNPAVKEKRLQDMVGKKRAKELLDQSETLTKKYRVTEGKCENSVKLY